MEWTPEVSRNLAADLLRRHLTSRWLHVQGVAKTVEALSASPSVVSAAWLHDIGYSERASETGLHALDGARYLERRGVPQAVVSLVAFHTGAEFEAEERGMLSSLREFERPGQDELDLLVLADMTTGPSGGRLSVEARIAGILNRYESGHPVHRAVSRSSGSLVECCRRGSKVTGYPM